MISTFEPGNTIQFTFVSSVAPDSAPIFKMTGIGSTVVASITASQSDSTHYYAIYTFPVSEGIYLTEWFAQKTLVSSTFNFIKRDLYQVKTTRQI